MELHYELTEEFININNKKLFRIKALINFNYVFCYYDFFNLVVI